jgi:uncharacterized membrane protein
VVLLLLSACNVRKRTFARTDGITDAAKSGQSKEEFMPPLHPAFVHFPIALIAFSFVMDLLGRILKIPSLKSAAFWALIAALITGAITAITGLVDYSHEPLGDTTRYATFHMYTGIVLVVAVILLTAWRWAIRRKPNMSPGGLYLIAALIVTGLTTFQGWYGGEMVYSQGAAVAPAGKSSEPPANGKQRLDKVTP